MTLQVEHFTLTRFQYYNVFFFNYTSKSLCYPSVFVNSQYIIELLKLWTSLCIFQFLSISKHIHLVWESVKILNRSNQPVNAANRFTPKRKLISSQTNCTAEFKKIMRYLSTIWCVIESHIFVCWREWKKFKCIRWKCCQCIGYSQFHNVVGWHNDEDWSEI